MSELIHPKVPPYEVSFRAYERIGVTVYHDQPDPVDAATLKPVTDPGALKGGEIVIIPGLCGGFFRARVKQASPAMGCLLVAYSLPKEQLLCSLRYDEGQPDVGIPGTWVCAAMGNLNGLRGDF